MPQNKKQEKNNRIIIYNTEDGQEESLVVQKEGNRYVSRSVKVYNLL